MTNESMQSIIVNAETTRQDDNKSNQSDKLNEIIKDLCDWMADTKFIVREISFFPFDKALKAYVSIGKNVDGKIKADDRIFCLGECLNSQSWEDNKNDLELECMLEELKKA